MAGRLNILFIVSDQHNAKLLGHEGHPDVLTPHLDALAATGTRFSRAIAQSTLCTPSRVSFTSGQYCHNHGYYGLNGPNPRGLPNIFDHFRAAEYATAAIGKIHCPENWVEDSCTVFHETCFSSVGKRSPAYARFLRERGKEALEDHWAMSELGKRGRQSVDARPSPLTFEESQEGWIVSATNAFMQDCAQRGQPFLAYASFPRPHQCTAPSEQFWSMYDEAALTLPPNADHDMHGKAPHMRRSAAKWRRGDWTTLEPFTFEAGRLRKLHGYLGAVSQVDHAVGEMLGFLRNKGLEDNTIVVFTSDHGDYACEFGIMEKAPGICADAITRVPLLWRLPGLIQAGRKVDQLAEHVDISATLCSLAGLEPMETSDGKDLSGILCGGSDPVHRIGVTELPWSRSVRQDAWRLVVYPREMFPDAHQDGFGELYNLDDDPWEQENLYLQTQHRDRIIEMERALLDWLLTTTRPATAHGAHKLRPKVVNRDMKIHPDRLRQAARKNYL